MHIYPEDLQIKLEFDKILSKLSSHCLGAPAKDRIMTMRAFDNRKRIERMLDEIQEFQKSLDLNYSFPISHYESIDDEISLLAKIDYVLELEQYLNIYIHIRSINDIHHFFKDSEKARQLPLLNQISEQINIDPNLIKSFQRVFSEEGKIRPDASPELARLFKLITSKERELNKVFGRLLEKYKNLEYLTDNFESIKNSRRVLSVTAENKRKIKGIIHDESATGKTVFIEPEEILQINNELFEFEADKRQEIYKILRALSAELRPYLDEFELWQKILIRYDLIRSKALFALRYNGQRPDISDNAEYKLVNCYHPILLMLNNEEEKETVPFNLELDKKSRILVISGPNAGGKSVTLKAAGLNQLMLQSGLLVPCDSHSSFPIFQKMMIDIGDQQSLEGDLSTYSSRLKHMKHFVDQANKRSLILIDEFGSGSDPQMGGAIAEAILDALVKKKCYAVITTHYSNIKDYAYKNQNILNGAMLFNREALRPTYQLEVGQPGSSFAFELARQIGLQEEVLEYAGDRMGKASETVDKLLIDLQSEKRALDENLLEVFEEKRQLKKLIENYERMKAELEIRRKRLKMQAREKTYFNLTDAEKEIQELLREARKNEKKNSEALRAVAKKVKSARAETREEIEDLSDAVFESEVEQLQNLEVGQYVKLKSGGDAAKVIDFDDKKVKLEMGLLQLEVPRSELLRSNKPIENKKKSIVTDTVNNPYALETQLDIRGYSKADAISTVQEFLDNALMGSIDRLKILHGKGSGVLKKVVWAKAREYKDIKKIWHPEDEFGGTGVTFISF